MVASGNVVHNLRGMDWSRKDEGFDWARRFDEAATERMTDDPAGFASLDGHPDFRLAAPTPDHFIPALYLAGLVSAAEAESASVLVDGCAYGSLSMTAYSVGLDAPVGGFGGEASSAGVPVTADVPIDGSNL